jgi:hypothetical protein
MVKKCIGVLTKKMSLNKIDNCKNFGKIFSEIGDKNGEYKINS